MGKGSLDFVPMQLTKAFRQAQSDQQFLGWLKMQEAVMEIEFPFDVNEVRDQMYTKDSLAVIENRLQDLYPTAAAAFDADNVHTTMRYVYYVGETFRRAFGGTWVALPNLSDPIEPPHKSAVDFPMREAYVEPAELVKIALTRRTGQELTRVYGYAERDYDNWLAAGCPERTYLGRLREEG